MVSLEDEVTLFECIVVQRFFAEFALTFIRGIVEYCLAELGYCV